MDIFEKLKEKSANFESHQQQQKKIIKQYNENVYKEILNFLERHCLNQPITDEKTSLKNLAVAMFYAKVSVPDAVVEMLEKDHFKVKRNYTTNSDRGIIIYGWNQEFNTILHSKIQGNAVSYDKEHVIIYLARDENHYLYLDDFFK